MEGNAPTSLADLKSGVTLPGDKDESPDKEIFVIDKPYWYDEEQFKRGKHVFTVHLSAIVFSYLCAIMVGFTVDQLTNALVFTGLSVGPAKSRKRYVHTIDYLIKWHTGGDIFDPNSVAGSAILKVRHWHRYVRTAMSKKAYEEIEETAGDRDAPLLPHTTLPMNQYDMALVQSGFIGPMILNPKEIGINASEKEIEDYVYFWRVVGWCLGIRDEYNMCAINGKIATTISHQVEQEIIVPGLRNPTPHFTLLCTDFVKGMRWVIPGLNQPAMYKYLFPRMGLPPPRVWGLEWFYYWLIVVTSWLTYHVPPMEWLINFVYKYYLVFVIWVYAR